MNWYLLASAAAGLFAAAGHSYLGERFVLLPLYADGGDNRVLQRPTMRRLLRWVWHLPSFAWATIGAATLWFAIGGRGDIATLATLGGGIYLTGALANLWAMRGPHVGNIALGIAAVTLWLGAT